MANIKQIAKLAGVSISTVSRVLNNHAYVSADKRNAVMKAIECTNYSRNSNAIHLSMGRTNIIGVILPFINHAYFSKLVNGISTAALQANYQLMLCQTGYNLNEEKKALDMLKMKQVDGLIICSKTMQWEQIEPFCEYGPIVACEDAGKSSISSIHLDHYGSFQMGMQYLIKKGHEKIGFCLSRASSGNSQKRVRAYKDSLKSIHKQVKEEWMFYQCLNIEDGVEVVKKLIAMKDKPTALLVTSDQVAVGIIIEAKRNGIEVPKDIAIIGFDNQPIAKVFDLTTIDNQLLEMGSTAFKIAYDQIMNKRYEPIYQVLDFKLIERSTV